MSLFQAQAGVCQRQESAPGINWQELLKDLRANLTVFFQQPSHFHQSLAKAEATISERIQASQGEVAVWWVVLYMLLLSALPCMRKALGASFLFQFLCFFLQRIFLGRGAGLGVSYMFSCSVDSYLTRLFRQPIRSPKRPVVLGSLPLLPCVASLSLCSLVRFSWCVFPMRWLVAFWSSAI